MTDDLYNKLICALTHDITVCDECKQCEGNNCSEIRIKLIDQLATQENKSKPWKTEESN